MTLFLDTLHVLKCYFLLCRFITQTVFCLCWSHFGSCHAYYTERSNKKNRVLALKNLESLTLCSLKFLLTRATQKWNCLQHCATTRWTILKDFPLSLICKLQSCKFFNITVSLGRYYHVASFSTLCSCQINCSSTIWNAIFRDLQKAFITLSIPKRSKFT